VGGRSRKFVLLMSQIRLCPDGLEKGHPRVKGKMRKCKGLRERGELRFQKLTSAGIDNTGELGATVRKTLLVGNGVFVSRCRRSKLSSSVGEPENPVGPLFRKGGGTGKKVNSGTGGDWRTGSLMRRGARDSLER